MVIPISDTLSARPSRSYHPATFGSYRNSYFASDAACRGPLFRPPSGSSRRVALRAHTWSSICPYSSSRRIGSRACVSPPSCQRFIGVVHTALLEVLAHTLHTPHVRLGCIIHHQSPLFAPRAFPLSTSAAVSMPPTYPRRSLLPL